MSRKKISFKFKAITMVAQKRLQEKRIRLEQETQEDHCGGGCLSSAQVIDKQPICEGDQQIMQWLKTQDSCIWGRLSLPGMASKLFGLRGIPHSLWTPNLDN